MKVLWYANTPCLYKQANAYNGGGWLTSLQQELMVQEDVELAIAFALNGEPKKVEEQNVTYYPLSWPKNNKFLRVAETLFASQQSYVKAERKRFPLYESTIRKPIEDFKPDVIMVFGSEMPFGLVASLTNVPVVLHIQGVLTPYLNAFLPPFVSWSDYIGSARGVKAWLLRRTAFRSWKASVDREQEIFRRVKYYIGRTEWDKRVTQVLSPNSMYFYGSEVLRPVFYESKDRILPEKLTIVTTISSPLYKGFDMVLKSAKLLKDKNIDFSWKCYGNIDPYTVEKITGICHNDVNVELCGVASAEQLQNALQTATCYVHTSYIDNSPNSLCEAQILGVTPVATYVGGVPSLIQNGETGYLVPANDPYQLSYVLMSLYTHPERNLTIGMAAREVALKRHNKNRIVKDLLTTLQEIVVKSQNS